MHQPVEANEGESSVGNRSCELTAQTADDNQLSQNVSQEPGGNLFKMHDEISEIPARMKFDSNSDVRDDSCVMMPIEAASSAGSSGQLCIVDGKLNPFDDYGIDSKGLFIIIKSTIHFCQYNGEDFSKIKLNYDEDVKKLLEIFNLEQTSPNVIFGDEITPDFESLHATEKEKSKMFKNFMKSIEQFGDKPSFVFFALLSHGFADGSFLLSAKQSCKCENNSHRLEGECVARKGYDDIIKPIQMCPNFHGIPKVIFMQTCRGQASGVVKTRTKAGPAKKSPPHKDPDSFIPELSDTVVVYASTKHHLSWVSRGSLLIDALYNTSQDLMRRYKSFDSDKMKHVMREYGLPEENLVDGWIFDILQQVSAIVSKKLVTNKEDFNDKQQPVFVSSLRYRLSYLRMLLSER